MALPHLDAILNLPIEDRLDLVEAIWDSLADTEIPATTFALDPDQRAELERRLAAHLADPDTSIPWEEVRRRLTSGA